MATQAEIDKAPRPGGLYYRAGDDKATDAEGNVVEDAPPKPEDTPPEKQPGYISPIGAAAPAGVPQGGILVTPEMLQQMVAVEVAKSSAPTSRRSSTATG